MNKNHPFETRLVPQKPLPPYAFLPGANPHPFGPDGHGIGHEVEAHPLAKISDFGQGPHQELFLYALDLYNHGFYWEAHVYWEALWNAFNRQGINALAIQALIFMAAAGVKWRQEKADAAQGHQAKAQALWNKIGQKDWHSLSVSKLIAFCQSATQESFFHFKILPQNNP